MRTGSSACAAKSRVQRDIADVPARDVEPRQPCTSKCSVGVCAGKTPSQILTRCATSGKGNCTMKRMRRRKAVSSTL